MLFMSVARMVQNDLHQNNENAKYFMSNSNTNTFLKKHLSLFLVIIKIDYFGLY